MKVLIVCNSDEIGTAESIVTTCTASGAEFFIYGSNSNCNTGLYSCLESNDLVLIIWNDESLRNNEIIFSTGYCAGKGMSFILYRENEGTTPQCNRMAVIVSKREELKNFIVEKVKKNTKLQKMEAAKSSIIEMGLEFSIRDLVEAVSEGEALAVEKFIIAGFPSDSCDKNGVFLLNIAVRKGHEKIVSELINNGADINIISGDRGNTPVMDAAAEGNTEILDKLISAGAKLDIRSKSGQTALILAVGRQAVNTALTLIESGADIDIKDDLGMTAKKYAELFKLEQVLSSIEEVNK